MSKYVEWQSQGKCTVLIAKTEQHYDDLGVDVYVWNVKTDTDGDWWVVEGDNVPMNLYPQSAYYFGADEVYSFHMGLMQRMSVAQDEYNPEDFVNGVTLDAEIAPQLFRKLKSVATLIDTAKEIEDFQAIGESQTITMEVGSLVFLLFKIIFSHVLDMRLPILSSFTVCDARKNYPELFCLSRKLEKTGSVNKQKAIPNISLRNAAVTGFL